ncbi:hypothetical protein TWF730_010505 [Orbilia blumenaviensis]|uniref:Uncharacterized protein n=1 Tax=Orbilia blumenaviensis TaxID=1796055 RepID=A0AAV9UPE8_9PEZI
MIICYDEAQAGKQQVVISEREDLRFWRAIAKDEGDLINQYINQLQMLPRSVGYRAGPEDWDIVDEGVIVTDFGANIYQEAQDANAMDIISPPSVTEEEVTNDWQNVMNGMDRVYSEESWRAYGFDPDDLEIHPWPLRYGNDPMAIDEEIVEANEVDSQAGQTETVGGSQYSATESQAASDYGLPLLTDILSRQGSRFSQI